MIDVRVATNKAVSYFQDLRRPEMVDGVRLEEIVPSDDEKYWLVTLSYLEEDTRPDWLARLNPLPRNLRVFQIDAESGIVRSVTMKPDGAAG